MSAVPVASAWPVVQRAIAEAPYPVVVLPVDRVRAGHSAAALGLGTRSWLGAVVGECGGLLVDHGWLRVLGGGSTAPELPDLATANGLPGGYVERLVVAYDVLGGLFAVEPTGIGYLPSGSAGWEPVGVDYPAWLAGMLSGGTHDLYRDLRWPGWQREVAAVSVDHGLRLSPSGRRTVSIGELFHRVD
jgi:hypothetical protein